MISEFEEFDNFQYLRESLRKIDFSRIRELQELSRRVSAEYSELLSKSIDFNMIRESMKPVFEASAKASEMLNSELYEISARMNADFQRMFSSLSQINFPKIEIPAEIYSKLDLLSVALAEGYPVNESISDLPSSIVFAHPHDIIDKPVVTWDVLQKFLIKFLEIVLIPVIITYGGYMLAEASNKKDHEEKMTEERKQTSIMEKQLAVDEENLKINKERNEREKTQATVLFQVYNSLLESIQPYINQISDSEEIE